MNISENAKNTIDNCRFCWMCRHVCPIGNATGQERNTARARAFAISMVERKATELSEVAQNVYECSLCGACTNNCATGFDPKAFIQEAKREIVLEGLAPDYINRLIENHVNFCNVYGAKVPDVLAPYFNSDGDILFIAGVDAVIKTPECVINALALLSKAGVRAALPTEQDTGFALWFLTGKTSETAEVAKRAAERINKYKTAVVYDPKDLAFIKHEYNEWGIEITSELISFNDYLLSLIESGKIAPRRTESEYTLQDSYAYARELDDTSSGRALIESVGLSRDMLLCGKETNLAGHLIMAEYMPQVIKSVALERWNNAINMGCRTLVTESPDEYLALFATVPSGYNVISIEEMLLRSMER